VIVPVILAGGVGSRLWPQSRATLPKQFIQFAQQDHSLFQSTLLRLQQLANVAPPLVICNSDHQFLVTEQLDDIGLTEYTVMLEPCGRNTAPAAALAALQASQSDPDAVLLVLPADHLIADIAAFHAAAAKANSLAGLGHLVTFGIVPGAPETGYGYIKKGSELKQTGGNLVESFVEKPDLQTAREFIESGNYLWNSGMFMFQATAYLQELRVHAQDMAVCCETTFAETTARQNIISIPASQFEACPANSIDYAVMEHTSSAVVVPLDAGWNDLGAWNALWEVAEKDSDGNLASGDVRLDQVNNCYIQAQSKLVAGVGLENLVVVDTDDALLVAAMDKVQDVKNIVAQLDSQGRAEIAVPARVRRPWGTYESLLVSPGYQVKRIEVNPGASLSLQMHHHRAEHWTIVKGQARVTRDDTTHDLQVNESIHLPLGCKHRMENIGAELLVFIEVQVGDYLGEDDIVRFEDRYGRAEN